MSESTYITSIEVNLWTQELSLEWTGPLADEKPVGPFRCSPGAGLRGVDCDDVATSKTPNTNCTPKGSFPVLGYMNSFPAFPSATYVTLFQSVARGIALHYYPSVPRYPASSGCVRIESEAIAREIFHHSREQSQLNPTMVVVRGELRPDPYILRQGNRSDDVAKLQRRLIELGHALPGSDDGDFGPITEQALKSFQTAAGLVVDGVFGPITHAALFP